MPNNNFTDQHQNYNFNYEIVKLNIITLLVLKKHIHDSGIKLAIYFMVGYYNTCSLLATLDSG